MAANPTIQNRIFGLDVLRCSAVICVLLAHTLYNISPNTILLTNVSMCFAFIGVDLFFVLSGFLIGTIIIKINAENGIANWGNVKQFWIRRWFRTLPNYYLIMGVSLTLVLMSNKAYPFTVAKFVSYFVFLQDSVSQETNQFFGVSWSLCVEEWFYLLFPVMLLVIRFFIKKPPKAILFTIAIFAILPLLGRIGMFFYSNVEWDAGFRKLSFTRIDSIGIGVLCGFIKYYFSSFWDRNRWRSGLLGLIGLIFLIFYLNTNYILPYITTGRQPQTGFFMKTFFFTFLSIVIGLLIPVLYNLKVNTNNYACRVISFISLISYSLYLLHPVFITIITHFLRYDNGIFKFVAIWALSILGAYLQYEFFEKRMTALREYFDKEDVPVRPDILAITQKALIEFKDFN